MDVQKVDMFLTANAKMFPSERILYIRERLLAMPEDRWIVIQSIDVKDPTIAIILSVIVGFLGVDRIYIGDIGLGILKLLTGGVCGIMTIVDWCIIMNRTREVNFEKIMLYL